MCAGNQVKTPDRTSPAVRTPFKPEGEEVRVQQRLISPAAFEPQYSVQASPNNFSLHSTICREEIVFDYDLSKVNPVVFINDLIISSLYSFYFI